LFLKVVSEQSKAAQCDVEAKKWPKQKYSIKDEAVFFYTSQAFQQEI
jgi:hypothetical protein